MLADEPPLLGEPALVGEVTLLSEAAVEDEAVLDVDGPPLMLLRRLMTSSTCAALKRSSVRACISLRKQFWQNRAAGSFFPLEVSQVAGSSLHKAHALRMSSMLVTISRQVAPSAWQYCLLPRGPMDE